jgi:hypothetical protein
LSDEKKPEKKKRDWLAVVVDTAAVAIIGSTIAFVVGIFIYILRLLKVLP